jgi:PASTA domain
MKPRHGIALILALLTGAALATVADGQSQGTATLGRAASAGVATVSPPNPSPDATSVLSDQRTFPHISPPSGSAVTVFTLSFTLRDTAGHEGILATEYRVQITQPEGTGASCVAEQPSAVNSGTAGELKQIALAPSASGWCQGTYGVTVFLQRGPYCPPPMEGKPPTPCPEFATQELETGSTSFTIGTSGPLVAVPNLIGLRPRTANRHLKRLHLRDRYTALSNLCAGIQPHGRIILQKPDPGTMVPQGTRVLVQTSCAR